MYFYFLKCILCCQFSDEKFEIRLYFAYYNASMYFVCKLIVKISGSVVLFLLVVSISVYSVTVYKRHRGYAFQKLEQIHEEDASDEILKSKSLLTNSEYRDDSTSEDELYNTYAWKNGRR